MHLIIQADRNCVRDGVQIHALKKRANRLLRMTFTVWEACIRALSLKAELFHFHDPELLPVGFVLQAMGKKVIFDVHENIAAQIAGKHWLPYPLFFSRVYSLLERFFLHRGMYIILAEKSYLKHYESISLNCMTLLNYPNVALKPIVPYQNRENAILYVGGIGPIRGFDEILYALSILNRRGLLYRFDCIGSFYVHDYEKILHDKARYFGIENIVYFHGSLDNSEALNLIGQSRIGVSIMRPVPNYIESYSTKIFEYMGMGIPFIVSNFPIYRDIISIAGRCGILVDPLDAEAIADSIHYLLTHPTEAEEMGRRGRRAFENHFNWHIEEKKLLDLYARLLH